MHLENKTKNFEIEIDINQMNTNQKAHIISYMDT